MMGVGSARSAEDDLTPRAGMSKLAVAAFATVLDTPTGPFQFGNQLANFLRPRMRGSVAYGLAAEPKISLSKLPSR